LLAVGFPNGELEQFSNLLSCS